MMAVLLLALLTVLTIIRLVRSRRRLRVVDFTNASLPYCERRQFACTTAEMATQLRTALKSTPRTRVVAERFPQLLIDVQPHAFTLDDLCGLGVLLTIEDADERDRCVMDLHAFKKSLGRGDPALLAFSMRLRRSLREAGVMEWDPHR